MIMSIKQKKMKIEPRHRHGDKKVESSSEFHGTRCYCRNYGKRKRGSYEMLSTPINSFLNPCFVFFYFFTIIF